MAIDFSRDYYADLEVASSASSDELKKAYRKLAMKYHPDRNPGDAAAEEKFKRAALAYEILGNDALRGQYDHSRAASTAFDNFMPHDVPPVWVYSEDFAQMPDPFADMGDKIVSVAEMDKRVTELADKGLSMLQHFSFIAKREHLAFFAQRPVPPEEVKALSETIRKHDINGDGKSGLWVMKNGDVLMTMKVYAFLYRNELLSNPDQPNINQVMSGAYAQAAAACRDYAPDIRGAKPKTDSAQKLKK